MGKIPEGLLKWREKQKRGAIMKPSTFEHIKETAKGTNPEAIAGAAYWRTAKSKYKENLNERIKRARQK